MNLLRLEPDHRLSQRVVVESYVLLDAGLVSRSM
jgi:hypothetical protein